MPARDLNTTLLLLAASIVGLTWAAGIRMHPLAICAAALALIGLSLLASSINATAGAHAPVSPLHAARSNALLMALIYGWGGLAMLAVYLSTDLGWRHGWQYGSGMLLIAAGLYIHAQRLRDTNSALAKPQRLDRMAWVAFAQGVAASIALVWLALSGKLASPKGDWAANYIFVAGGLAIVISSLLAFLTHRRLASR